MPQTSWSSSETSGSLLQNVPQLLLLACLDQRFQRWSFVRSFPNSSRMVQVEFVVKTQCRSSCYARPTADPFHENHSSLGSLTMNADRKRINQRILDLTLEILFLLTGEHYRVGKRPEEHVKESRRPEGSLGTPPRSPIHKIHHEQKILELSNQIIRLLTGEVPIRCEDVTVYLSMEEWEYVERHKELYEDVMMEDHQVLHSLGETRRTRNTPPGCESLFKGDLETNSAGNRVRGIQPTKKPSTTMEELASRDVDGPTEHTSTEGPSTCKEETPSNDEESHIGADISVSTVHSQPGYQSSHIKEEPASCVRGDLLDTDMCTPAEHTQTGYPHTDIKEEPSLVEKGTIKDHKPSILEDHTVSEFPSLMKEEPASCDEGNLTETDIYPPKRQTETEHPSVHVKEESPSSSDGKHTATDIHSCTEYMLIPSKVDSNSGEAGDLMVTGIDTTTEFTQTEYSSTHMKEEPRSCVNSCITYTHRYTHPKQTQRGHTTYINEDGIPLDIICRIPACPEPEYPSTPIRKQQRRKSYDPERRKNLPVIRSQWNESENNPVYASQNITPATERLYNCSECQKCFASHSDLAKHQTFHKGKKLTCFDCGKFFSSKYNLLVHHRTHTGEKQFSCSECKKCFSVKSNLISHQRIHRGEKPFTCSECGRCFSAKSSLISHQKIHTGERPFSCLVCGKRFSRRSHLTSHQNIHTREKKFPCSTCGSCFTAKSSLIKHQRIHTGEKPFSCNVCGKTFTQSSNLVSHQRIHFAEKSSFHRHNDVFSPRSDSDKHPAMQVYNERIDFQ
uniref:Uncharacterized protein n=1 Tax=Leptobrachium leishanense TaxID=445787 RepID=A0A8C5MCG3_9ANUR